MKFIKPRLAWSAERRIDEFSTPEPNSGCWLWTNARNGYGYGVLRLNGARKMAHRLSYELKHGEIPSYLTIDHLCRTRCCVNPDHLEVVTRAENRLRAHECRAGSRDLCVNGHPFTGVSSAGKRVCRVCANRYCRESRARLAS